MLRRKRKFKARGFWGMSNFTDDTGPRPGLVPPHRDSHEPAAKHIDPRLTSTGVLPFAVGYYLGKDD